MDRRRGIVAVIIIILGLLVVWLLAQRLGGNYMIGVYCGIVGAVAGAGAALAASGDGLL